MAGERGRVLTRCCVMLAAGDGLAAPAGRDNRHKINKNSFIPTNNCVDGCSFADSGDLPEGTMCHLY